MTYVRLCLGLHVAVNTPVAASTAATAPAAFGCGPSYPVRSRSSWRVHPGNHRSVRRVLGGKKMEMEYSRVISVGGWYSVVISRLAGAESAGAVAAAGPVGAAGEAGVYVTVHTKSL